MHKLLIGNRAPRWIAAIGILVLSGLVLLGLAGPGASSPAGAAPPSMAQTQAELQAQTQKQNPSRPLPRESGPPTNGPAPRTGPASPFEPLVDPVFGDNNRANTDTQSPNRAQQEPSMAVNPTNPLNVVVAAKDERAGQNTKQVWIYTSTDGGVTWINQEFPLAPPASAFSSDPVVNFSDDGQLYVTALPYGGGATDGIQVARSTDGGITFSTGVHLPGSNSNSDKEWTWVDNFPSSPYYHRIYTAWMNFGSGSVIAFNYSTDRGVTWSPLVNVGSAQQFPMPVTLPNGDVILTDYGNTGVVYRRSTDGGQTFGAINTISSINDPNCPPDNSGCGIWRLNAIPANSVNPTNGTMVVTWADGRNGSDPALTYYSRSTDNGATWSAAAPLALPGAANVYQVEPWVATDELGNFHAIWYDDRDNPDTSTFNIYYSESTDNGATWSTAQRISTATSDLRIGIPSSYALAAGDYINVTASHGNVYACWTDTRSGTGEDIYVVRGTYGGTPTPTVTGTPPTNTPTSTRTNTPTVTPTVCQGSFAYSIATATATIVAGTTDIGNHCDDCSTQITLPFAFRLYDQTFTSASVSSDGDIGFVSSDDNYLNSCLPDTSASYVIYAHWDDLCTGACGSSTCTGCGVFTSVSGTAPNRILNVEWRTNYYNTNNLLNFEVRLYENSPTGQFDIVYGASPQSGSSATVGVQRDQGSLFTQYECNTGGLTNGLLLTFTQAPCGTPTVGPSSTATPTTGPTNTVPPSATNTPGQQTTSTALPTGTTAAATSTVAATETETPAPPTLTATACSIQFTDVPPNSTFYQFIHCLVCLGIVNGYPNGTFRPNADVTRGQLSKIVANSAGFNDTPSGQQFQDVPPTGPDSTFYVYIYRLVHRGFISGYPCGGPLEPCVPPANLPYFRPNAPATRGQISKIVSNAAGYNDTPTGQQFQDVAVGSTFYDFIYRLSTRNIINGYTCGSVPQEPCVPPANLPYFRPNADATRGQMAKIDDGSLLPSCTLPSRR